METALGIIFLILVIAFLYWKQKKDIKAHGQPTKEDRLKTYFFAVMSVALMMVIFYISGWAYTIVAAVIYLLIQVISIGVGKRGWYRQIRDGVFLGWSVSIPICLNLWLNHE